MAVSKTEYGNWYTLEGTLAEVMGSLKGKTPGELIAFVLDQNSITNSVAICVHKT